MAQLSTATVPSHRARFHLSSAVFIIGGLFLWSQVLQAPLRYGLALIHLGALVYLPKLLLLAAVVFLPILRPRAPLPTLILSGLVGLYLLWGLVNLSSKAQALFGLWVMIPFLFGLWAGPLVESDQWRRLLLLLILTTAVGVFLSPLLSYPWSGHSMNFLGKNVDVSRQWTALGVQRYAGFARASYNAAGQLLLFALMLLVLLRCTGAKLFIWFLAGAGIALTTSKGPFGAWLILSLYFLGGHLLGWPRYWNQLWLGCLGIALLAMSLIPLSTLWMNYDTSLHGYMSKFLFSSFGDRLSWMWPSSWNLLNLNGGWHWWVGRGLGGIGAAQQYFKPANHLAGDNFFVYVAVIAGLPIAFLLFLGLWFWTVRIASMQTNLNWRFGIVLTVIAYGVVATVVENTLFAFFLGLALGFTRKRIYWGELP